AGPRRERHDRAAHHAVPRRGRAAGRPDRHPPRGPGHRARHTRRAQGPAAAGDGRVRREAAHPRGRLPRPRRPRRHHQGAPMTTHFVGDPAPLTGRSLRHITRSLDTIITTTIMPIAFLLLFVFVFGG